MAFYTNYSGYKRKIWAKLHDRYYKLLENRPHMFACHCTKRNGKVCAAHSNLAHSNFSLPMKKYLAQFDGLSQVVQAASIFTVIL
jgi:hypothetical protein